MTWSPSLQLDHSLDDKLTATVTDWVGCTGGSLTATSSGWAAAAAASLDPISGSCCQQPQQLCAGAGARAGGGEGGSMSTM